VGRPLRGFGVLTTRQHPQGRAGVLLRPPLRCLWWTVRGLSIVSRRLADFLEWKPSPALRVRRVGGLLRCARSGPVQFAPEPASQSWRGDAFRPRSGSGRPSHLRVHGSCRTYAGSWFPTFPPRSGAVSILSFWASPKSQLSSRYGRTRWISWGEGP